MRAAATAGEVPAEELREGVATVEVVREEVAPKVVATKVVAMTAVA